MRYDQEGKLFFPVFVSCPEGEYYISLRYRLYPDGDIILTNASADCDENVVDAADPYIHPLELEDMIIDFVCDTIYDEIISQQSC